MSKVIQLLLKHDFLARTDMDPFISNCVFAFILSQYTKPFEIRNPSSITAVASTRSAHSLLKRKLLNTHNEIQVDNVTVVKIPAVSDGENQVEILIAGNNQFSHSCLTLPMLKLLSSKDS